MRFAPEIPAELLDELDAAWARSETLALDFRVDPRTGRVRASLDGERLSALDAVLIACGDAVA